jgi:hypothetical protein
MRIYNYVLEVKKLKKWTFLPFSMANVKLSEKSLLERFQARIVLAKGHKVSQQELLDKCVQFSSKNFQLFLAEEFDLPVMTKEKMEKILANAISSGYAHPEKSDDELLYGNE